MMKKKIIAILFAAAVILQSASFPSFGVGAEDGDFTEAPQETEVYEPANNEAQPEILIGDLNDDGVLGISDAVMLQKYFAKKIEIPEQTLRCADMNEDGFINVFDMVLMKRKLMDYTGDMPDIDETEARLRAKYPEYFDLSTFKGLELYVCQFSENNYDCILTEGTNRNKTEWELMDLYYNSASVEDMKAILSYYSNVKKEDIYVIYWQNPLSSYYIEIDAEQITKMFFE